jgi:endonuclease YncB( thermonuclease family)
MKINRCYLLVCVIASITSTAQADIYGKVVAVSDGDTIKVLDSSNVQHKVRLTGIDAPEKAQPFGNASRNHLASLVAGKGVHVESSKTDRYGRVLGKVWVQPGNCPSCSKSLDANHAQILSGMAWWYRHYAKDQPTEDRERYKSAVSEAKEKKLGLWSEPNAIPPWAWRRGQRPQTAKVAATNFQCGSKRYCREMTSCDEARFYLRKCGLSRLDGDKNGVPCESICR